MRGEVLHYDEAQGFGFIAGADGNRYTFRREDLLRAIPLARGATVDFRESGVQARDVSLPSGTAQPAPAAGPAPIAVAASAIPAEIPRPQHFGRNAATSAPLVEAQPSTGLWSYFRNALTANYATFSGRARRKEYWAFVLFSTLALIALGIAGFAVDAALGNFDPYGDGPVAVIVVVLLAVAAGLLPGIAVTVRRFHDVGMSGWFYLLFFVLSFFTIGGLIILVVTLIPSQKRDNKWGPIPVGVPAPAPYVPETAPPAAPR